ncbi:hypothetical protein [Mycobacterium sp. DL592]|uniref:hypothetical protein n=1 Tax=Mycobacterium sp. DL592 TaxID=2675524 RepID=UPI001422159F|nr:hypothetical protein [Mycobacterium sp. DL592]
MARDTTPWYRSSAATLAGGLLGLGIIAALVFTVIKMSGQWNTGETEPVVPPGTHLPEPPHFAATTTAGTSTTYTTVRLSTTDIGLPGETPSSTATTTPTDGSAPPTPPPGAVAPTFPGSFPTRVTHPPGSTRSGPRLNETRTLYPQP